MQTIQIMQIMTSVLLIPKYHTNYLIKFYTLKAVFSNPGIDGKSAIYLLFRAKYF